MGVWDLLAFLIWAQISQFLPTKTGGNKMAGWDRQACPSHCDLDSWIGGWQCYLGWDYTLKDDSIREWGSLAAGRGRLEIQLGSAQLQLSHRSPPDRLTHPHRCFKLELLNSFLNQDPSLIFFLYQRCWWVTVKSQIDFSDRDVTIYYLIEMNEKNSSRLNWGKTALEMKLFQRQMLDKPRLSWRLEPAQGERLKEVKSETAVGTPSTFASFGEASRWLRRQREPRRLSLMVRIFVTNNFQLMIKEGERTDSWKGGVKLV